ncbi:MAG: hypothetical protein IJV84_05090 [Bacteroidales bacterium]|nr:hypothetical protein [Bacteroidales bacterium]
MKKIILLLVAVLASVTVFAQRGIPRTNNVSVSSTIVTKKKSIVSRQGFQQSLELGTKLDLRDEYKGTTGVNYIGGYRFNSHFFAGIGVGLECAHFVAKGVKNAIGSNTYIVTKLDYPNDKWDEYVKRELHIPNTHGMNNSYGSLNRVSIPLYLHLKGYYTKTKCAPYSSLSIGGIFAPKENGLYLDFSTGVDVRLNDTNSIYFAAGFWYRNVRDNCLRQGDYQNYYYYLESYHEANSFNSFNSACTINYEHYHFRVEDLFNSMTFAMGLSLHVGFSF